MGQLELDVRDEDVLADARTSLLQMMLECDALIEEVAAAFRAGLLARTVSWPGLWSLTWLVWLASPAA